jgi:hypothetical protein
MNTLLQVLETKIDTKSRKDLPNDAFGLPDDRKYPLIDEEHIKKAIQMFKHCPATKRLTLAKNINKQAKTYKLKFKVSEDSIFYKYADVDILKEDSAYIIEEAELDTETRNDLPDKIFGLPKERKYPLNNKQHILNAIQRFNWCTADKRVTLAKNINKRARSLGMKINVSKDSSFYKYAAKDILSESYLDYLKENKLDTEERNDLPTKIFGLPDERKYPLNDKQHVINAIQRFNNCEISKRHELAKHINLRAKQLKLKFNLKEDSPFYEYADKSILTEDISCILTESKLESEDRDTLPPSVFGLPEERKYPLNDELHVRKAIQFFNFCHPSKKSKLAKNINKQAIKFGMKIKISKSSSFYKYASKEIIEESKVCLDDRKKVSLTDATGFSPFSKHSKPFKVVKENYYDILDDVSTIVNDDLNSILFDINSVTIATDDDLYNLEDALNARANSILLLNSKEVTDGHHMINIYQYINSLMEEKYVELIDALTFVDDDLIKSDMYKENILVISIIKDIFYALTVYIRNGNTDPLYVKEKIEVLFSVLNKFNCNYFIIQRLTYELIMYIVITEEEYKLSTIKKDFTNIKKIINSELFAKINFKRSEVFMFIKKSDVTSVINALNIDMSNTNEYLNLVNTELKDEINNILKNIRLPMNDTDEKVAFDAIGTVDKENLAILDILTALYNQVRSDNIKAYSKNYTFSLEEKDVLLLNRLEGRYHDKIIIQYDRESNPLYFGVSKNKLFLYGKDTSAESTIIAIMLYHSTYELYSKTAYETLLNSEPNKALKIFHISYKPQFKESYDHVVLTEGLSLNKDGDITFTLKPKKSYMDTYDECHKQLISNWDAKNYKGVKNNLAFLFTLIIVIDRKYMHDNDKGKKVTSAVKEDAIKARMFAINDFKTYMKKIKIAEPEFDFTEYFEKSNYDKLVIKVSKDTIVGIKRLFQSLMMGL